MYRIFILYVLLSAVVYAQTVTVKNKETNKPLELVSVFSENLNRSLTTDSKGKVLITTFKNNNKIVFRLMGYKSTELTYSEIEKNNFIVVMEEDAIKLNNVIVTAKRWEEELREIPQKVEFIDAEEITFSNPQTTADMLTQTGNVYVQKSQLGGGSPMIRGFATNRVLIIVDNVRMNNAIFRSGNLQNVISLDANSLANAQIIFGPGSVMYGSDAIGGIMEFNTLNPPLSYSEQNLVSGSAFTRYSTANNEKTGHMHLGIGLDKIGFLSSVTYSEFGDLKMGSNGPDDYLRNIYQARVSDKDTALVNKDPELQKLSGYNQWNVLQKIRFKPDEDWDLNYGFYFSTTSDVPRYDRLIELKDGLPRDGQWYYGPQKWMMNNINISNFSENLFYNLSKLTIAYQTFEESRHNRSFGKNTLNHRTENVSVYSLNLDFIKTITEKSHMFYGFEGVLNKVGSTAELENIATGLKSPLSTRYPDGSTWNSYGVYVTYKNKIEENFIVQTGLRYNLVELNSDFDTTFYLFPFTKAELSTGAFTGNAGIVWFPESEMQLNLNLSTGFRAPNIDDIGKVFDSEPGAVVVPNPNLESEYIYNLEIGLAKAWRDNFKIDLTGFYSFLDNALVRRDFTLNGFDSLIYDGTLSRVQAIQNAASAKIWGIQAGVEIKIINNVKIESRISYQKGEEEDDSGDTVPLRHAAPWYGTTKLIYNDNIINVVFYADYNGEVSYNDLAPSERAKTAIYALDDDGNPYAPAWYTLNIKTGFRLMNDILVNLGVENITDQRYRTYSSGISAAGRNFIGSVRYNF
ncbi:MAG: TonB-dependent receptor [Bacteroidetes bacterium]|nr:TonB-dependent receptor [Bacteroidota bacterium]